MLSDYTFREKIVTLVVLVAIFVQYYYIFLVSKQTVVTGSYSLVPRLIDSTLQFMLNTCFPIFAFAKFCAGIFNPANLLKNATL